MSAAAVLRITSRGYASTTLRTARPAQSWRSSAAITNLPKAQAKVQAQSIPCARIRSFSATTAVASDAHQEESFEEFTARYEQEFEGVQDSFELQRNLNNAFAYDLVPSPSVIVAALRAARRVNDFPTAVRIFEGIKAKVENQGQYDEYLKELADVREELGVNLKESMYPDA